MTAPQQTHSGTAGTTELLRLATIGGRSDRLRIALTIIGSLFGTMVALLGVTVAFISETDGPYSLNVLAESGLRPGVITALLVLCAPIVLFVGLCTRVGAPARDRRLAMYRMAGATPSQATKIASYETGFAALIGAISGLAVFQILRAVLDAGPRAAERALPTDVSVPIPALVGVVVALAAGALFSATVASRKVRISPFGVTRTTATKPPTRRAALLFAVGSGGLVVLGAVLRATPEIHTDGFVFFALGAFACFALCLAGLLLGSASVAYAAGKALAPRASRPDVLIAARRMIAAPHTASRTTASVILVALIGAALQGTRVAFLTGSDPGDDFYANTFDLINVVLIVAAIVATASLLVTASESIVERRRTLASLVASGTPRPVIARAAMLESLIPLVPAVLVATASGWLFARSFFGPRVEVFPDGAVGTYIDVPIPWTELALLGGGVIVASVLANLVSLAFLSASTRPTELRAAA